MEKTTEETPSYKEFESQSSGGSSKSKLFLVIYSAVASTLLVVVMISGGLYYSHHVSRCSPTLTESSRIATKLEMHEEHYKENGHDVTQQVTVDPDRKVEVIRYKSPSESGGVVVVLDYTRSLTSIYVPAARECFLIGGIDRKITAPLATEPVAAASAGDEETINYMKADDYPVVDHTMLPMDLQDTCRDKPIFWLERQTQAHASKAKREVCAYACYNRNGVRICAYYCN